MGSQSLALDNHDTFSVSAICRVDFGSFARNYCSKTSKQDCTRREAVPLVYCGMLLLLLRAVQPYVIGVSSR